MNQQFKSVHSVEVQNFRSDPSSGKWACQACTYYNYPKVCLNVIIVILIIIFTIIIIAVVLILILIITIVIVITIIITIIILIATLHFLVNPGFALHPMPYHDHHHLGHPHHHNSYCHHNYHL